MLHAHDARKSIKITSGRKSSHASEEVEIGLTSPLVSLPVPLVTIGTGEDESASHRYVLLDRSFTISRTHHTTVMVTIVASSLA